MKNVILLLFIAVFPSIFALAQFEYVNAPPINAEIFAQRIMGSGVEVFNAKLTCPDKASGFFRNGSSTNLGMESGIVLTTGSTEMAFSANTVGDASVSNGGPGYGPLEEWYKGYWGTFNACVFEFDFIPYGDSINLNYIFASEEYPEWVGSQFNDIFAILIEGLPEYPEDMPIRERNIAIIPTSPGVHVAINFLNFASYNQFYQDNTEDPYIQYDGQTVRLPAKAKVTPCNTYHLVFAITDVSDAIYDSGLFIEEGSFSSRIPQVVSAASNFNENIQTIYESSSEGVFTFAVDNLPPEGEVYFFTTSPPSFPVSNTFSLVLGGTATLFEDYTLETEKLIFYPQEGQEWELFPEQATQQVTITPIADDIEEEAEYVTVGFYSNCSQQYLSIDTLWIEDPLQTGIEEGGAICFGESFQLSVFGGDENTSYQWTPAETLDDPTIANPIASPTETTTYVVTVTNNNGYEAQHGVTIEVAVEVTATLTASSNIVCPSSTVVLSAIPFQPTHTYTFYDSNGEIIESINNQQAIVYPETTSTYTVVVSNDLGCTASDELTIEVETNPTQLAPEFIACEGEMFVIPTTSNANVLQYLWSPTTGLDDFVVGNPTITAASETITYNLMTVSELGCVTNNQTTIEITDDCVFPGDTDNNGEVNIFDLFPLGRHFGKSGNARNSISNEWRGFGVRDWGESNSFGQNLKYIDCNGNGQIGIEDTTAILQNFDLQQKSHNDFAKGTANDPPLLFIPNSDQIGTDELLELEVWIGSDLHPVTDLYAIAFETYFSTDLIEGRSISLDYSVSTLGTVGEDMLTAGWVNNVNGRINASMTKIDGVGKSGRIHLLTIRMKSQPLLDSPANFTFHITDFGATDSTGEDIFFNVDETPTIRIDPDIVGIEKLSTSKPYQIYPTFTQNGFYIEHILPTTSIAEITLFDLSGQRIALPLQQTESSLGKFRHYVDLKEKSLTTGVYIVELKVEDKVFREKIVLY